jgi:hypothetical protein
VPVVWPDQSDYSLPATRDGSDPTQLVYTASTNTIQREIESEVCGRGVRERDRTFQALPGTITSNSTNRTTALHDSFSPQYTLDQLAATTLRRPIVLSFDFRIKFNFESTECH